jgi:hypothetical protein
VVTLRRTIRRRDAPVGAGDGNEFERLALFREYRMAAQPSDVRRHIVFIDRKICSYEDVLDE